MDANQAPLHKHLKRLSRITVTDAVYFITVCTHSRRRVLDNAVTAGVLRDEWASARERHGWRVGRYVVMPDHVHFFCQELPGGAKRSLSQFMKQWKEWSAKGVCRRLSLEAPVWQAGFFDHVLRSAESYAEKWAYVRGNPVRAGLVALWDDWPHQGWIDFDQPGCL